MWDFYKRLNIPSDASDVVVRQSVKNLDGEVRAAAETVLLSPRRRKVYDRNRQLLMTIGRLRLDLDLNYTRFWTRKEFRDFSLQPVYAPADEKPKRRVNKMMIAQAFRAARHYGRRHVARWGGWWMVAASAAVAFAAAGLWLAFR